MFIIFGFGHRKLKKYGFISENCHRCNNYINRELVKASNWFTLFFIPVFPYRTNYFLICPICHDTIEVSKDEFFKLAEGGSTAHVEMPEFSEPDEIKYAGKTPTQINYIKQMEEYERKEKEKNNS